MNRNGKLPGPIIEHKVNQRARWTGLIVTLSFLIFALCIVASGILAIWSALHPHK